MIPLWMPEINEFMVKDVTEGKVTCKHPQRDLYKVLDTMPGKVCPLCFGGSRELESISEGVEGRRGEKEYEY